MELGATVDVSSGLPGHTASEASDEPLDQTVVVTPEQGPSPAGDTETGQAPTPTREMATDPATRHTVTRFLAEGGLGKVYVAQDDELQRAVVMKTLKEAEGENSEARYRFVQEAQVNSQLEHPNIVPIYQAGRGADGQPYYTMKYVRGQEYRELIQDYHQHRREGNVDALELRRLLTLFISTCQAVSYAHNRGVVHRDLKPENVAVGEFGELMVLDWGLAKVLDEPDTETSHAAVTVADEIDLGQTMQGRIMGTPGYMAPEQASGESDAIEPRTDVYSLGAMLFEILTGEAPHALLHNYDPNQIQRWNRRESHAGTAADQESVSSLASQHSSGQHENTMKLLARVISDTVPAPSDIEPTVPRALEAICQRAMRLKIEDRYTTASDVAHDVERWLADEPVTVYAGSWNERLGRWMRKHRTKVQAIGASFAIIALVAIVSSILINNQRQLAVAAERTASEEADKAKAAERVAVKNTALARKAQDSEAQQRHVAEEKQALAERNAYSSDMLLASVDWEAANIGRLRETLDRYRERADLKGFEWSYWDRLVQSPLLTLKGHTARVFDVSFSPDGTQLASASEDNTLKLWNAITGQLTRTLKGHTDWVTSVSFSPDGKRLASTSRDQTVKLWNVATGQQTRTLKGHAKAVNSVCFSPDGTQLASAGYDRTVKLWDATTGQLKFTLKGHSAPFWRGPSVPVISVSFSPDGTRLASVSSDETVTLWDVSTGQQALTLKGHTGVVNSVIFSPDGTQLASASYDRTLRLWDAATGQELRMLEGHSDLITSVIFSPDGKRLASAAHDQTVRLWDTATGQEMLTLKGHAAAVNSMSFSPDGTRLASASTDGTVKLWDAATGQETLTLKGHTNWGNSVIFNADGTQLASTSMDRTVKLWDVATGQETRTLKGHSAPVMDVRYSPDGSRMATASRDNTVKLWSTTTGRQMLTLEGHTNWVNSVSFSPDGKWLASASKDTTVKLWDAVTGQEARTFKAHTGSVRSVSFSPAGTQLVTSGTDNTVKLWDLGTGQETRTLKGHSAPVHEVSFSPDGTQLASASMDNTVKLWNASTGQEMRTLKGHTGVVTSASFSPDGTQLASASTDKTVKVWDTATGQERLTLKGHTLLVVSVTFSPDGTRLASTSEDRTVKLWDSRPWTPALRIQSRSRGLLVLKRTQVKSLDALKRVITSDQTISDSVRQQALAWSPLFWESQVRLAGKGDNSEQPRPPVSTAKIYAKLPDIDVTSLSDEVVNILLKWCHDNPCPCGCGLSFAACRNEDRTCGVSIKEIRAIVAELGTKQIKTADEAVEFLKQKDAVRASKADSKAD